MYGQKTLVQFHVGEEVIQRGVLPRVVTKLQNITKISPPTRTRFLRTQVAATASHRLRDFFLGAKESKEVSVRIPEIGRPHGTVYHMGLLNEIDSAVAKRLVMGRYRVHIKNNLGCTRNVWGVLRQSLAENQHYRTCVQEGEPLKTLLYRDSQLASVEKERLLNIAHSQHNHA
jgi:hypothetical protein